MSNLDLDKCYTGHNPEQNLRSFNNQLDISSNTNVDCNFQVFIIRKVFNEKIVCYSVLKSSRDKL